MLEKKKSFYPLLFIRVFQLLPHTGTVRHMCCCTPRTYPRVRTTTLPTKTDLAWYQHIAELNRGSEDAGIFNYSVWIEF